MQAAPNVTFIWQRNGQRIEGGKFSVGKRQVLIMLFMLIMLIMPIMLIMATMVIWSSLV